MSALSDERLPLNARIPVLGAFVTGTTFQLTTEAGAAVTAEAIAVSGGFMEVPSQPLAPDAGYVLTVDFDSRGFRTGAAVDEVAPPAPTLGDFSHSVSPLIGRSSCDLGGEGFLVSFTNPAQEPVYFELFTGRSTSTIDHCPSRTGLSRRASRDSVTHTS